MALVIDSNDNIYDLNDTISITVLDSTDEYVYPINKDFPKECVSVNAIKMSLSKCDGQFHFVKGAYHG